MYYDENQNAELVHGYNERKAEIDSLIDRIRNNVLKCKPIEILKYSQSMFQLANLGITSEIQATSEAVNISRSTEYIQSILVSSPANIQFQTEITKQEQLMNMVLADVEHLFELINVFYMFWVQRISEQFNDNDTVLLILEEQLNYGVRGNRYQVGEIKYYKSLLSPHNDEMIKLFGLSSDDLIDGFEKLEHALSQGKFDAANNLRKLISQAGDTNIEDYMSQHYDMESGKRPSFADIIF